MFLSQFVRPVRRRTILYLVLGVFLLVPCRVCTGYGKLCGAHRVPRSVVIDQAWQKASAKYDAARAGILADVERAIHQGPFRPDWESLQKYEVPEWYKDAKLGIFIHWGVYSVPAFGSEWYPRDMYREGSDVFKHHVATYGPQDKFGYKDFVHHS